MANTTINFGNTANNGNTVPVTPGTRRSSNSNDTWKKVAIGGISAVAFGGAAYAATSLINNDTPDEVEETPVEDGVEGTEGATEVAAEVSYAPYNPSLQMATSVNDDMTFAEAFKAAREEVHAGGVFEWHGQVYGTYYGNEWDALSPADQSAFTASTSQVVHDHTAHQATAPQQEVAVTDVEEVEVETEIEEEDNDYTAEVVVERVDYDPESEINMAYVTVDNTEVILTDIDNDGTFDVLFVDENGNGHVEENELIDISDENITVDSLGGYTEPELDVDDDFLANNDTDIDSIEL